MVARFGLELLSPHLPVLTKFVPVYVASWLMNLFHFKKPFPHIRNVTSLSLIYTYIHSMHFDNVYSLVPSALTFINWTHSAMYTKVNHPNFFCNPLVRINFQPDSLFPRTADLHNRLNIECFLKHYNFDLLKSGLDIIFPAYLYEFHSKLLTFEACIGWALV